MRLEINERIMTHSDIKNMFTKHLIDSHKVNYKAFL